MNRDLLNNKTQRMKNRIVTHYYIKESKIDDKVENPDKLST